MSDGTGEALNSHSPMIRLIATSRSTTYYLSPQRDIDAMYSFMLSPKFSTSESVL